MLPAGGGPFRQAREAEDWRQDPNAGGVGNALSCLQRLAKGWMGAFASEYARRTFIPASRGRNPRPAGVRGLVNAADPLGPTERPGRRGAVRGTPTR